MAYTYGRRVELARQRLAAAGIETGGRNPEKVLRTLSPAERRRSAITLQRAEPGYRPGRAVSRRITEPPAQRRRPSRARTPTRQKVETTAGTITTSRQQRVVRQAIRDAAAKGHQVAIRATFVDGNGKVRTRYLDGSHGGVGATGAAGGQAPIGKVVVVTIPPWVAGDGLDPQDLIDSWDDTDGWDWLVDLWDEEYSEL